MLITGVLADKLNAKFESDHNSMIYLTVLRVLIAACCVTVKKWENWHVAAFLLRSFNKVFKMRLHFAYGGNSDTGLSKSDMNCVFSVIFSEASNIYKKYYSIQSSLL